MTGTNAAVDIPIRRSDVLSWIARLLAAAGAVVVLWVGISSWDAIVHGHPALVVVLVVTVLVCAAAAVISIRRPPQRIARRRAGHDARPGAGRVGGRHPVGRLVGRIVLVALGAVGIGIVAWLRPHAAVEPALDAMRSGDSVIVEETSTSVVLRPVDGPDATGVFFQPGALVDARAYAAVLRPLAENGHTVVIAKQPLGIAFLALDAFDAARAAHPDITGWVVGGHSLGGTVAAIEADAADTDAESPATGLLFYASYPATDMSASLTIPVESISGTRDGLSTPAKIEASRTDLPGDADFTVVDGASHAQFGDYGAQSGDGVATITHAAARTRISAASVAFVTSVASAAG